MPNSGQSELMPIILKIERKSTRLNSSPTEIYTLSLHYALPIYFQNNRRRQTQRDGGEHLIGDAEQRPERVDADSFENRAEEHTSELQSHRDLHSFPTLRSSDLFSK